MRGGARAPSGSGGRRDIVLRLAWRQTVRPVGISPCPADKLIRPRLIRSGKGGRARFLITDAATITAVLINLFYGPLYVQHRIRIGSGERHMETRQALPERGRIKLKALAPGPAVDAGKIVVCLKALQAPARNAQDMIARAVQV